MSHHQWHSILPPGALNSSALAEDLAPALEQAGHFGTKHILFSVEDRSVSEIARLDLRIREKGLSPQHFISLDEFALDDLVVDKLARGSRLVVVIDREPSAAAIEKMGATRQYLEFLTYVVIGRKDWRFKDTFRSLPHHIRERLYLDFPVSIHSADPFYSPAELGAILAELSDSSGFAAPASFSPHFGLRQELLRANVIAASGPSDPSGPAPLVSLVVTEPDSVNRFSALGEIEKFGPKIEFVVARVIGQATKPIEPTAVPVSHVWLHLEDSSGSFPEMAAHLRNWGARYARGKILIFADGEAAEAVNEILVRVLAGGQSAAELLDDGVGIAFSTDRFREAGGYDPLYCRFNLGDAELLHRYLGGLMPEGRHAKLAESLRGKIRGPFRALAVGLFHHQYFDQAFFRYFSPSSAEAAEVDQEGASALRNQFRYRVEQSRDAYLGIYKASPRVALDGHIQILLKPYHWIKPHAWLLKMPVYPLVITPYHFLRKNVWPLIPGNIWKLKMPVYPLVVRPYHFLRKNVWPLIPGNIWKLKMPVYPLVVRPYHFLRKNVWPLIPGNIWRLKMPVYPLVVQPYHFFRQYIWRFFMEHIWRHFKQNLWKIKYVYYFVKVAALRGWGYLLRAKGLLLRAKGQLWRVKQVYYFIFWLLFPVRKIYYFAEYQFEKRILGLYGRQHVWIRK